MAVTDFNKNSYVCKSSLCFRIPDDIIEKMHMTPAHSIEDAIRKAKRILGKEDIKITAIPDGVSVIVKK